MPCYLGDFSKRGWERFRGSKLESNRIKKGPQDRKNDKPPKLRERVKETTTHVLLISSSFIQGAGNYAMTLQVNKGVAMLRFILILCDSGGFK